MRRTGMKPGRRRTLTAEEREQSRAFHLAFTESKCAVCGTFWLVPDPHHVVEAQELRDRGLPAYDVRNGLPLCPIGAAGSRGENCHERHTNASRRVPFRKLRPENIAYAYAVLGDFAGDYLKKRYPMEDQS